jgi:DNA repair exonuclease SbcCD ATPase subunit
MKVFEKLESKLKENEIDEEIVNDIVEFAKKEVPQEFIPKEKYNEKVSELESINEQLDKTNQKIEELSQSDADLEEYKKQVKELKNKKETFKEEYETKLNNIKKQQHLKDYLLDNGADRDNIDLLLNDFNVDEMQLKDDKIVGIDEYVNEDYKQKRQRLFVKQEAEGSGKPDEGKPAKTDTQFDAKLRQAMGLPVDKE